MAKKKEDFQNSDAFESGYSEEPGTRPMGYPSADPIVEPVTAPTKKKKMSYERGTYYLYPEHVEAIRIYSFNKRQGVSETMRDIIEEFFGDEKIKEARENLRQKNSFR